MALKLFWGTEERRPNIITKDAPVVLIAEEIPKFWGPVIQIYISFDKSHIGVYHKYIASFCCNHLIVFVVWMHHNWFNLFLNERHLGVSCLFQLFFKKEASVPSSRAWGERKGGCFFLHGRASIQNSSWSRIAKVPITWNKGQPTC